MAALDADRYLERARDRLSARGAPHRPLARRRRCGREWNALPRRRRRSCGTSSCARSRTPAARPPRHGLACAHICCIATSRAAPRRRDAAVPEGSHSWGEFVFDFVVGRGLSARRASRYYPRLVSAVPFTPATGPRLLAAGDGPRAALVAAARGARPAIARRCPRCTCCFRDRTIANAAGARSDAAPRLPVPLAQRRLRDVRRFPGGLYRGEAQESCGANGGASPKPASTAATLTGADLDARD